MIKIPMDALKDKGEDNSEVMPEVGDEVMLGGAKGIFKGEKDGMAMVELQELGGVPISYADKSESDEEDCDDEGEDSAEEKPMDAKALMAAAMKADKEAGYDE